MKQHLAALAALLFTLAAPLHADDFADIATISPTTTLQANHLCYTDGTDLACSAPSNTLILDGTISATTFIGDGSGLTGVSSVSTLASLTDVSAASPILGDTLQWNGSAWNAVSASSVISGSQVAFSVQSSVAQTVLSDTHTTRDFNIELFDTNNDFDLTTDIFTASIPGKYLFNGGSRCLTASNRCIVSLSKNGVRVIEGQSVNASYSNVQAQVSSILDLNIGDEVLLTVYNDDGTSINNSAAFNFFNGALINAFGNDGSSSVSAINDLSDVSTAGATTGQTLAYNGSSWVVSDTAASISALNDIGDVSATAPTTGSILRYDGTNWATVSDLSTAISTTSMLSGWPDMIVCKNSSLSVRYMILRYSDGSGALYSTHTNGHSTEFRLEFDDSGDYSAHSGMTGYDCLTNTWSIADLYANGQAFNFLGNNGAQISLTEVRDVSASAPSNGEALVYNSSNDMWEPGTVATASTLASLTDVTAASPILGDTLQWNGSAWNAVSASSVISGSQVAFSVHRNGANQTITSAAWTNIDWITENFDTNNNFDLSTERFTPTVPGKYMFNLQALCSDATTQCNVAIMKNGSFVFEGYTNISGGMSSVSGITDMNGTTDYIEAQVYNGGGTLIAGGYNYTNFQGALINAFGNDGGGGSDDLGNHTATQALDMAEFNVTNAGTISATDARTGAIQFEMVTGGVPISNTVSSGGSADNLGNHTATQALNMNTNNITSVGTINATGTIETSSALKLGNNDTTCTGSDYGKMRYESGMLYLCRP